MIKIELEVTDEKILDDYDNWEFFNNSKETEYGLSLYLEESDLLEDKLRDKNELYELLDLIINLPGNNESYQVLRDNVDSLEDNIEYVVLRFKNRDYIDFIKNNSFLKDKKIVISEALKLNDYEKVEELLEKYKDYKDNLYFPLSNNDYYIKLEDCYKTMQYIKGVSDSILELGLSPMETIMYTYDYVRNREYKAENQDEDPSKSRDLTSIILGDKIVCVGFANLFDAIIYNMGIRGKEVSLISKSSEEIYGHRRNLVYVKDNKYDIDGVYYFDATFDCKKEGQVNEFLYRYRFFAKTIGEMTALDKHEFIDRNYPYYSDNMNEDLEKLISDAYYADSISLVEVLKRGLDILPSINNMARIVDDKDLLYWECLNPVSLKFMDFDKEEVLERLKNIQEKYTKPIPAETFIRLLNNVRKVQHSENPEFYPYSIDSIYSVYKNSRWQIVDETSNEQLFKFLILGDDVKQEKEKFRYNKFIKFIENEGIAKEIENLGKQQMVKKK